MNKHEEYRSITYVLCGNTHPAIIDQEIFDMVQAEMQRRRGEKDTAVGFS